MSEYLISKAIFSANFIGRIQKSKTPFGMTPQNNFYSLKQYICIRNNSFIVFWDPEK